MDEAVPKPMNDEREQIYARDRLEWRQWLDANHAAASGVWLIFYKKRSGKPSVSYDEAVEEALCFGWIDSKLNALDDERYIQLFTPRKPKSPWSKSNKERVEKLIEQGRMTPAGVEKIETAKRNGMWKAQDPIEALTMPEDLLTALKANPAAEGNFHAFSDSLKKQILRWIDSAKRPDTRLKRIEHITDSAERKENPFRFGA